MQPSTWKASLIEATAGGSDRPVAGSVLTNQLPAIAGSDDSVRQS